MFRREDGGAFVPVKIGSRALDILRLLVERADDLVLKEEIFAAVWPNTVVEEGNLTTQISALRRALGRNDAEQTCIQTVAGRGYRLIASAMRPPADLHAGATATPKTAVRRLPRIALVVLPFASLSPDPEHEYFADAIIDDLTAGLSRIADSFVVARTTAFSYKGKAIDVREVAHELGVHYVIEGSIRRQSDRVQVNAQLIDGETGSHVWADRFDSDRSDPAEAQSEVVGRLTNALTHELIGDVARRIEQERAAAPEPRDLVLRATALRLQTSIADRQARRTIFTLLERALILDPQSLEARLQLARTLVIDVTDAYSTSIEQDKARAETLISEALAWDPHNSEAHRIMGLLRRTQGRWAESQVHLETAVALDPNNVLALRHLGLILRAVGKLSGDR